MRLKLAASARLFVWLAVIPLEAVAFGGFRLVPLTVRDGLIQSTVYSVCQDRAGFMWFATGGGVSRYDGYSFLSFTTKDGLPDNTVFSLAADKEGRVWLGTWTGLAVWAQGKISPVHDERVSSVGILDLLAQPDGSLWVATRGKGVVHILDTVIKSYRRTEGLPGDTVSALASSRDGGIWVGMKHGSIAKIYRGSVVRIIATPELNDATVMHLSEDSDGTVWVGTDRRGVFLLKGNVVRRYHTAANDMMVSGAVNAITRDSVGALWLGTERGILRISGSDVQRWGEESLADPVVWDFCVDREGNMWAATAGGVVVFIVVKFHSFTIHDGLPHNVVWSFGEDRDGSIFIGTNRGLARCEHERITFRSIPPTLPKEPAQAITVDRGGTLWVAYYNRGVYSVSSGVVTHYGKATFGSSTVFSILQAQDGSFWFGTDGGGAVHLDHGKITRLTERDGLGSNVISAIAQVKNGAALWFGTYGAGLTEYRGGRFRRFTRGEGLPHDNVLGVLAARDGSIWAATDGGVVQIKDEKIVAVYTDKNGLPHNLTFFINEDRAGNIWAGTVNGVARFDGKTWRTFGPEDGLADRETNQGATLLDSQGRIWVGTIGGASYIDPLHVQMHTKPPHIAVTGFFVNGKPVALPQEGIQLEFASSDRAFRVEFAALTYVGHSGVLYKYRLLGSSDEWSAPMKDRQVVFPALVPGEYTLEVSACNTDGVWTNTPARIQFSVLPPIWKRTWFLGISLLVIAAIAGGAVRLRFQRSRQRERQLAHLVNERTANLRVALDLFRQVIDNMVDPFVLLTVQRIEGTSVVPHAERVGEGNGTSFLVSEWNSAAASTFGIDRSFALGKRLSALLTNIGIAGMDALFRQVYESGKSVVLRDVQCECQSGSRIFDVVLWRTQSGVAIAFHDTTEHRRAEEERAYLREQLAQAQRMESIGLLAGGIAHDFNNLLGGILGYASFLKTRLAETDPMYRYVDTIERSGIRAAELTSQLLAFARGGKYDTKPVKVERIIEETLQIVGRTFDRSIEIVTRIDRSLPAIEADAGQIQQVLMNLFVNARDAMPGGGRLIIEAHSMVLDEDYAKKRLGAKPGPYVVVSVTDTGVGMDKQTLSRVFEPFFTTKEKGKGTGLGLAVVYGIVKNHGGFIRVYSEVGEGTTFRVFLPASEKEEVPQGEQMIPLRGGNELILVVDDEESIRTLVADVLGSYGYKVLTAKDGEEAIEIYRERYSEISLVILDMIMPKMGGHETFRKLREINRDVRAILSTGFSQNGRAQEILREGVRGFIQKPYNVQDLVLKVRKALDAD